MSTLIQPLIFPQSYTDESPISYLIRVSEQNEYRSVQWLFRDDAPAFTYSPQRLLNDLNSTPWAGFTMAEPIVHEICNITSYYLQITNYRFCVECLNEASYHRARWHLVTSVACTKHKKWLIDECPTCHIKLNFKTKASLTNCVCGASILEAQAAEAPSTVLRLQRFIDGLESETTDESYAFSEAFDGTKYTLLTRVQFVYQMAKWYPSSDCSFIASSHFMGLSSFPAATYYSVGFADAWYSSRDAFDHYLTRLHRDIYRDTERADRLFRQFYKRFFSVCSHPSFNPVKIAVQEYMNENWVHAVNKRNSLFNQELIDNHKWLALQAASKEYNIDKSLIHQGIDDGEIRFHRKETVARDHILVHRDDLVEFITTQSSYVNALSAASLLGVTKQQLHSLLNRGMIRGSQPESRAKREWGISIDDIRRFVDLFNSTFQTVEHSYIPFPEAIRKIGNRIKDPFITLVEALQAKELNAYINPDQVGLRRLCFVQEDLEKWYSDRIVKLPLNVFSVNSLRGYFRVSSMLIPQLIEKGLIHRAYNVDSSDHRCITYQAVEQFKQRYVLLSKLSRVSETSSAALMKLLQAHGVFPIDEGWSKSERFVQKIYYRHELFGVPEIQNIVIARQDWEML